MAVGDKKLKGRKKMELIAIGFLLGVVVCFVIAAAGMYYADKMVNRGEEKDDKDTVHKG